MEDEQHMVSSPRRTLHTQGGERSLYSVYYPPLPFSLATAIDRRGHRQEC